MEMTITMANPGIEKIIQDLDWRGPNGNSQRYSVLTREQAEVVVSDFELLSDPNAVHIHMLRGSIAKPTTEQIIHIYGRDALLLALAEPSQHGNPDVRKL